MYLFALLLMAVAIVIIATGFSRSRRIVAAAGILTAVAIPLFFWFMGFWGDLLWFENLHYGDRFLTAIGAKIVTAIAGALVGILVLYLLTWRAARYKRPLQLGSLSAGAILGAVWGANNWTTVLKFIHRPETNLSDPIFGYKTGFYLFSLPFYDAVLGFLLLLSAVGFAVVLSTYFRINSQQSGLEPRFPQSSRHGSLPWLHISASAVLVLLAVERYLARFHLMYSETGIVTGPGWVDIHVRLPVLTTIAVAQLALAAILLLSPLRRSLKAIAAEFDVSAPLNELVPPAAVAGAAALLWIIGLGLLPSLFQSFVVEPNEITMEKPYIANNIALTRHAFGLDDIQEREFPVSDALPPSLFDGRRFYDNIRLWDWRALDAVYQQFQEIRLYYEFTDVDVDRYTIDSDYREVMISAREMEVANLPADSQTFVNRRFKYTHGYGLTLTDVSEFTPDGLPDLLIKDIPPKSRFADLKVDQPRIYYGELTDEYVVVNSAEQEFDYPSGEQNVYFDYTGKGGVPIANLWRKFIYSYKFGGIKFFLSSYPTPQSRIMFYRQIRNRIAKLAPFLLIDRDPYVVLSEGRLYWIVDAYTATSLFPYSGSVESVQTGQRRDMILAEGSDEPPAALRSANYIRNSVKVIIDAYNGSVDFYIFTPQDPLIKVWDRIYPGMMKSAEQMPADLRRHIRYPIDLLLIQGLVYAKYHMTDPMVFYNQEDLWIRATEKYYNRVQPVAPYYIMWQPPEKKDLQFVLMLPFTPKNRQVMIGWIAGMCDGKNYGRLLAYNFPKERRVLGTQQVETKIDQDSFLSGQLSLWDQRGSTVIRGNVLAIPIHNTMLYVEPIYLQADTAAYPELRMVAVMHQDRLSYAETFDKALSGIFSHDQRATGGEIAAGRPETPTGPESVQQLVKQANAAFDGYLQSLGGKRFEEASRALKDLETVLGRLSGKFEQTPSEKE